MKFKIALGLLFVATQISWAQTIQDDLRARYRAFDRAIQRHDIKFLNSYLSTGFTANLPNGETPDREATLKGFGDLMNATQSTNWTFKLSDQRVTSRGVTVKAEGLLIAKAIGPDKKKHRIELRGVTEDTWIVQGSTWVLDHVNFLHLQGTIDGIPAPIPGIAP